jgi:hypothetical protein
MTQRAMLPMESKIPPKKRHDQYFITLTECHDQTSIVLTKKSNNIFPHQATKKIQHIKLLLYDDDFLNQIKYVNLSMFCKLIKQTCKPIK